MPAPPVGDFPWVFIPIVVITIATAVLGGRDFYFKHKDEYAKKLKSKNVRRCEFCSLDERAITTLGTGYVASFVAAGYMNRVGATVTNKRVYFSGTSFHLNSKGKPVQEKEQKIVNIRDVTSTGYKLYSPIHYLIAGGLAGLGVLLGVNAVVGFEEGIMAGLAPVIIGIVLYHLYRKTLMCIEYPCGNIAFDVRWFEEGEPDAFIRNIHLLKDKIYSAAAAEQEDTIEIVLPMEYTATTPQAPAPTRSCKMCSAKMKGNKCPACEWMCGRVWNGKEWVDAD
jgi:hypothetical protein